MNRVYKALVWLAGSGIVFGLAFAIMLTAQTVTNYAQLPHLSIVDGLFSGMFTGLYGITVYSSIKTVAILLVGGTMLLAIALAWADRRRGWLIALIVSVFLTMLWPSAVDAWAFLHSQPFSPLQPPSPVPVSIQLATFTAYAAPLVPVFIALIFALTLRTRASAPATSTDAELGIVRSSL